MSELLHKLSSVEARYDDLMTKLADPAVQADPSEFRTLSKALSEMEELVAVVKDFAVKGILIKDINIGLIDFPHLRDNGEEVYLCYLLGETSIQYWHTIDGGFTGRLSTDNL